MKNCICYLSILINLVACIGHQESKIPKEAQLKAIDPATRLSQIAEPTIDIDTIFETEFVEKKKEQTAYLELALIKVEALKKAYDEGIQKTENYVESIPFTTFLGDSIESGVLEVTQFGDQYTRIYADYFNGEPIGGKLFFVQNDTLIAIEVIQLKEKTTEKGTSIQDENTHILYYRDEILLSMVDLSTKKQVVVDSFEWQDENLLDWQLVKKYVKVFQYNE